LALIDPGNRSALAASSSNEPADILIQEFGLDGNPEQLHSFLIITASPFTHLATSDKQLMMYIGGVGGTGRF
jgi:hypothetical protein